MTETVGERDPAQPAAEPKPAVRLPAVHLLLAAPACQPLVARYGREQTVAALREVLAGLRTALLAGSAADTSDDAVLAALAARLAAANQPALRRLFNLTGTVLHTNLGRALLPDVAVQAVADALRWPMNLEWDLETGKRGDRDTLVEQHLLKLTGAEAVTIVNNNAAAVLLMLNTLASGREVIVSRGELVEIGGAFRIPDVMTRAGATLREVGATNRTHLRDYADGINAATALLMKVHASNYAITGFTSEVKLPELAPLARERNIPVVVDLGSGTLVDLEKYGLPHETTVRETIDGGADLVTFSGDKLLGGPQCGIIAGRRDLVEAIKANPLKRALRVGKLTLAALEPVLALYHAPDLLPERLTTLRLLTRSASAMRALAERLCGPMQQALGDAYAVSPEPMTSQIGSGALPVDVLPSFGLALRAAAIAGQPRRGDPLGVLERRLRALPVPVVGRIAGDTLWLDLRCLEAPQAEEFERQLAHLAPARGPGA
ncbi:L-seryl-tRNA(Sec) selenium transferase [Pseudoduganella albidiflava]|uniref:L-seryl-tRNA(Sec) selenium transferase n=1 Tax=Pseudoduganella albidiflava TaxID=321983 RepID=A0A411WZD1_9BURK|nr:L-seryl-tRNA(Sec) selenium transferase [Pseudoduganella albidiflava]QBI02058.1 L-seryl-tRNA(Sec) selenium transferase [Pseudoduganella albidiflava]GGY65215.1 L-seryl-tRNA(Sec) selenium transferase [Pseudoduganella albidiflava]